MRMNRKLTRIPDLKALSKMGARSLFNFNVDFSSYWFRPMTTPDKRIEFFLVDLKKLKSLSELKLRLHYGWSERHRVEKLSLVLRNMKTLVNLHLDFSNIGVKGIRSLFMALKPLKALHSLDLAFSSISDKEIKALYLALKSLKPVPKLKLAFGQIRGQGFGTLDFGQLGGKPICKLDLLVSTKRAWQKEEQFSLIKNHQCIKVHLFFTRVLVQNEIEMLSSSLKNYRALFEFALNSDLPFANSTELLLALRNMKPLWKLEFGLVDMNNSTLEDLSLSLIQLKGLSNLKLNFAKSNGISDNGVESLSLPLKYLKLLSNLDINLSNYDYVSDKGVESIMQVLKDHNSLSNLKLDFSQCKKINYKGEPGCVLTLKNLSKEHISKLNFFWFYEITNDGKETFSVTPTSLESLPKVFSDLKSLETLSNLYLSLSYCNGIQEKEIDELFFVLKDLKLLSTLNLDLHSRPRLSNQNLESLSYALKGLKLL